MSGRGAQQLQRAGHTVQPGLPYSWGGGGAGHVSWGRGWGKCLSSGEGSCYSLLPAVVRAVAGRSTAPCQATVFNKTIERI